MKQYQTLLEDLRVDVRDRDGDAWSKGDGLWWSLLDQKKVLTNTVCVLESKMTPRLMNAMVNQSPRLKVNTGKEWRTMEEGDSVRRGMIDTWCCPSPSI